MPLNACVLIKTTPFQTEDVVRKVRKLPQVRKAFVAYGRFDLVVFVRAGDYGAIRELTGTINAIEDIRSTETLVEA
jgi:DNA-binding Lrp family transcriptional regulator